MSYKNKGNMTFIVFSLFLFLIFLGCTQQQEQVKNETTKNEQVKIVEKEKEFYDVVLSSSSYEAFVDEEIAFAIQIIASKPTTANVIILYGKKSVAFPTSINDYETSTSPYTLNAPGILTKTMKFNEPGVYYVRVYAYINNKIYWSNELKIEIKERKKEEKIEDAIEVYIDEKGSSIKELRVKIGSKAKILFISNAEKEMTIITPQGSTIIQPKQRFLFESTIIKPIVIQITQDGKKIDEIKIIPS
jgi:hypothetical protein